MPKQYESIRDNLVNRGYQLKQAKSYAARIYNSLRKKHPGMAKLSNKPGR